ncbi:sulfotransferase domain-containing protein [Autumnicola musiva]|uniref:Sulfotransferase domain-containing protein n=1 Tax=Autumnicola musiva TaxID=3075589 RepID=A0ABU3D512_9FLAO|nr:sulfotransferase domain-containing protein [Zunongwangia sp. F117]MDT0676621.1 sulfotransferase domain-containing protein [Zunongwangia sp. F117]
MHTLQIGYPKSGNFWLYQILHRIFKYGNEGSSSFIEKHPIQAMAKTWDLNYPEQSVIDMIDIKDLQVSYRISSIFKMPIEDFSQYLNNTNHVWTHSPVCKRSGDILNLLGKKVYIVRDPRDVVISASKYFCSDYMLKYFPQEIKDPEIYLEQNLERLMTEWVWHVWDYLRLSEKYNIHICYFEGFRRNFQEELSLLLNYLEIYLNREEREKLEQAVSFKNLKKKNPRHLRKGTSGYWKEHLSENQKITVGKIAGPLINFLNYSDLDNDQFPRNFHNTDFKNLKEEIIASQQLL